MSGDEVEIENNDAENNDPRPTASPRQGSRAVNGSGRAVPSAGLATAARAARLAFASEPSLC